METVLVACQTISDEVERALSATGRSLPVRWIESGLHVKPDALRVRLQQDLDALSGVDRVLLAFGYCGNALVGLTAGAFRLTFPRADDCITLMLGSCERRREIQSEAGTYFLTHGWLTHEANVWAEYNATVAKRGKERADRVYATMLKHYRRLGVIDTGAYDMAGFMERSKTVASDLRLEHFVIDGTTAWLERLVSGPWDDGFVTFEPHETVTVERLFGPGPAPPPTLQS